MAITTLSFVVFLVVVLVLYYLLPKKAQWVVLLAASIFFYICGGVKYFIYVLVTASTVYIAARMLSLLSVKHKEFIKENKNVLSKEERKKLKKTNNRKRKALFLSALLLNIGILCYFKYIHFFINQINGVLSWFSVSPIKDTFSFLLPLGISFYTFQAIGYLLDIYWDNCQAETNFFKFLLFISFFPQITQGPISDFSQLSKELFATHTFEYKHFSWGFQRMIWGFFKKMIIADTLSPWVTTLFHNFDSYTGITIFIGSVVYGIQLYADFSGYMDIMCGLCEVLGIRLAENFDHPYFSKSVSEFWRRWHITMGAWFKKCVYYPIAISKGCRHLSKATSKFGKHFSESLSATVALTVTWLATGLWHGAGWEFIVWGLANGFFLILHVWLKPVYASAKRTLQIKDSNKLWIAFQIIRTFTLISLIEVIPEVGNIANGLRFIGKIFSSFAIPRSVNELFPYVDLSITVYKINIILTILGVIMMIVISVVQYKKPFRIYFNRIPKVIRVLFLSVIIIIIASFGVQASWGSGGFLYAQF